MPHLHLYNGKTNPNEFVMGFKARVESVGGDNTTMAKAFVLAIKGIALSWYTSLPPGRIYSWEQLREAFFSHFQGNYDGLVTMGDFFVVKQKEGERLKEHIHYFVRVKCQAKGLSDDTIIDVAR